MAEAIRQKYEFNIPELGFQKRTGTESAIHRHVYDAVSLKYTARLDQKAAYDSVLRKKLVEELAEMLSKTQWK